MQIYDDSIGKAFLEDIILRQPLYEVTRKNHFMFSYDSALSSLSGGIFHTELYSLTPAAFRHNF